MQSVSVWTLGWRSLWRDARAGELSLLLMAVTLAVAALTGVAFFADRLQGGLQRDARALLGGDAVVRGDQPLPEAVAVEAQRLGLRTARSVSFPTMGRADDADGGASRLVALKAVSDAYPLRGELQLATAPGAAPESVRQPPDPGTAWVESSLLTALDTAVGKTVWLGDQRFVIARVIVAEPDRGAGFMSFAPRVMIREDELAATGLVQPASRVNHRLMVVGPERAVSAFVEWGDAAIEREGWRGVRLESFEEGRPEMQQTLSRAEQFLKLVALLTALLAAVAVAIAARGFAQRHLDDCAMLRVLGLSQGQMVRSYTFEFLLVGVAASALGVALGYLVHLGFVQLLGGLVKAELPAASWAPVGLGVGVGLCLMAGFGLPPVLQLAQVPPLRVIRRDVGQVKPLSAAVWLLGLAGFAGLLWVSAGGWVLGGLTVGGFALALLVFAAVAWGAVALLRRLVNEDTAPRALVLATRQLTARPGYAVVQVSALAVGLLALALLVLLRTDLIASWRNATPPDAPNRFVINIQPEQATAFRQTLADKGVERYDWYPMIRGRLVGINGQPVDAEAFESERAQRLVEREFNLSHTPEAPEHNQVIAGRWQANEADGLSVEEGLAKELGLKLGDTLSFDMAGVVLERRITSLRKVNWGSLRVNFFVLFPVAELADVPVTFVSALRAPEGQTGFDNGLVRAYPNITLVDMTDTIAQVQRVLSQVIAAIEFLFAFALVAGLVVLMATLTATRTEREREFAVLRAVGAGSLLLRRIQSVELLGVGALAGVLGSGVAMVVGWALARYAFEFAWQPAWWVPVAGTIAGAVLAWLGGWWGLRSVLNTPVVQTLRSAAT